MGAGWLSGSRDFLPILRSPSLVFPLPLSLSLSFSPSPSLSCSITSSSFNRCILLFLFPFDLPISFSSTISYTSPPPLSPGSSAGIPSASSTPPPPLLLSDSACDISSLLLSSVKSPSFRRLLPISILLDSFFLFFFPRFSINTAKVSSIVAPRTISFPPEVDTGHRRLAPTTDMSQNKAGRRRRSSSLIYQEPPESIEHTSDQAALPNLNANWVNAKGESTLCRNSRRRT